MPEQTPISLEDLPQVIEKWAFELGFQAIGFTDIALEKDRQHLHDWLDQGRHGEMEYMRRHDDKRGRPEQLVEGTRRVISVRMDYRPGIDNPRDVLQNREKAYISRYTLGRDYHKLIRKRLAQLAKRIDDAVSGFSYRAFVDSAPVLERALAQKAGLGWIGKNTMLLNRKAGSFFFLGEIFTDAPLPLSSPMTENIAAAAAPAWTSARPRPLSARTSWTRAAVSPT